MRTWAAGAVRLALLAGAILALLDATRLLRDLPVTYAAWSSRSLEASRRQVHGDAFLALLEAARRVVPAPSPVVIWVPHARLEARADIVRAADRWMRAAYLLYPHPVVPLGSASVLPGLGAVGFLHPSVAAHLGRQYLPLGAASGPLAIIAFEPRLPDRLESLLVDQTDADGEMVVDGEGAVGQPLELPAAAWLSSVDLAVEGWTEGTPLRVALWDSPTRRRFLGDATRSVPSAGSAERFVLPSPVPRDGRTRTYIEVSRVGSGAGPVRVRGRPGRLWLRVYAAEPGVRPEAILPAGTVFVSARHEPVR